MTSVVEVENRGDSSTRRFRLDITSWDAIANPLKSKVFQVEGHSLVDVSWRFPDDEHVEVVCRYKPNGES